MKCKNCIKNDAVKYSKWSSGEFCSKECARSYATKSKRQEINEKVSKSLKGRNDYIWNKGSASVYTKVCNRCEMEFETSNNKRKYCSHFCGSRVKKPNNGGPRPGGGKSKVYAYVSPIAGKMKLNKDEIEIAKVLDILKFNWIRNWKGFGYTDLEGNDRKYYPDFYVKDFDYYIEYKGWMTKKMEHKMNDSLDKNNFKLLIIYGDNKRYKDLGLNMSQVIKNPNVILDKIGV